ncbi:MAG: hypothetical protein QOF96_2470 [Actinomycetota bacterium]|nr:hypothetical protein [Actinomycetota bacterium]
MGGHREHQPGDRGEPAAAKDGRDSRRATGRAESLIRELAAEARHIGQRLARLAALARVGHAPDPDGVSIEDLSHTADVLQGWADQLASQAAARCQPEA